MKSTAHDRLDLLPTEVLYDSADLDLDAAKKTEQRVQRGIRARADDNDLFVLDCRPGLSLMSANILRAADLLLVPLVPTPMSLRTLDQVVDFGASVRGDIRLLAFWSIFDSRRALHRDVTTLIADRYRDVAQARVPASAVIERMAQRRAPVLVSAPSSPGAAAYRSLWGEIAPRVGLGVADHAAPGMPSSSAGG